MRKLFDFLSTRYSDFEILLISQSDFHSDHSHLNAALKEIPSMRHIILFGAPNRELIYAAGVESCIGDIAITYNPNSDPLSVVEQCVSKILSGHEVIIGTSSFERTYFYSLFASLFRFLLSRILQFKEIPDATDLRALNRKSLNMFLSRKFHLSQFYYNISKLFPHPYTLSYQRQNAPPKKTFLAGTERYFRVMVLNSTVLLRLFSLLGLLGGTLAFFISLYVFVVNLLQKNIMEGWTSLSLFMSIQFCIIFLILFIYGEYMARLVDERRELKEYEVREELSSSVMLNSDRWNVAAEANKG